MKLDNLIKSIKKNGLNTFLHAGVFSRTGKSHIVINHRPICSNSKDLHEYKVHLYDWDEKITCKFCRKSQKLIKRALLSD